MQYTGAPGEYQAFRRQKYAGTRFLLGCNPSMKGDLAHVMFPEDEKEREIENRGAMTERTEADQGRCADRILRSACKPISISSEIRLSEFLTARVRLSRLRGPQLVYWPFGLLSYLPRFQDSSQYPVHYILCMFLVAALKSTRRCFLHVSASTDFFRNFNRLTH